MSIYAYIVAAVLLFGVGAAGGVKWEKGQNALREQEAKEIAAEQRRQNERGIDAAAVTHEKVRRELRTEFLVITEKVADAKQTEFYAPGAPLCLDDAGLRIVESARGAASSPSVPARTVR